MFHFYPNTTILPPDLEENKTDSKERLGRLPDDVMLIALQFCDENSVQNTHRYLSKGVRYCTQTTCITQAVKNQNVENMNWIKERNSKNGRPWNAITFAAAAKSGNIVIMEWLKRNEYPWNASTFATAAACGSIEVMEWLKRNKCLWNESTFVAAAKRGDIEILEWCKRNKCPWSNYMFSRAAKSCSIETLEWLKRKGCPWGRYSSVGLRKCTREKIKWLQENGCPWVYRITMPATFQRLAIFDI